MFFTITFAWFVRAVAHFNSFRNGAKNSTIQIKARYDDFQPVGEAAETLSGLCEKLAEAERRMMLRQKLAYDCRSAKRFHVRRTALVALLCRANRWFLSQIFK